jgi:hypothetical protein
MEVVPVSFMFHLRDCFKFLIRFNNGSTYEYNSARVTLRPMVSRSVRFGVEPHLGLMTRYELLFDSYFFVDVGRPSDERSGLSFALVT